MVSNFTPDYIISDVEGTLTSGAMWKAIGGYLNEHVSNEIHRRFLRRNLPRVLLYRFGLVERSKFQNRWIADQALLLKGRTTAEMVELSQWIIEHDFWPKRRQPVIDELISWRAKSATIALASGLYQPIVEALADRLAALPVPGMDGELPPVLALGTPLEYFEDRFTGRFAGPVCNGLEKASRVKALVGESSVLAAYGDSFSDIPMLELSQAPVLVFPDEELAEYGQQKGWRGILS